MTRKNWLGFNFDSRRFSVFFSTFFAGFASGSMCTASHSSQANTRPKQNRKKKLKCDFCLSFSLDDERLRLIWGVCVCVCVFFHFFSCHTLACVWMKTCDAGNRCEKHASFFVLVGNLLINQTKHRKTCFTKMTHNNGGEWNAFYSSLNNSQVISIWTAKQSMGGTPHTYTRTHFGEVFVLLLTYMGFPTSRRFDRNQKPTWKYLVVIEATEKNVI